VIPSENEGVNRQMGSKIYDWECCSDRDYFVAQFCVTALLDIKRPLCTASSLTPAAQNLAEIPTSIRHELDRTHVQVNPQGCIEQFPRILTSKSAQNRNRGKTGPLEPCSYVCQCLHRHGQLCLSKMAARPDVMIAAVKEGKKQYAFAKLASQRL